MDHFHFRAVWQSASQHKPFVLQGAQPAPGEKHWWEPYYDPGDGRFKERQLLSTPVQSTVTV